jgi:BioD-like phosphotransacetylase family protein
MKPLTIGSTAQAAADGDAAFMKRLLALEESVGELCPVALSREEAGRLDFLDRMKAAFDRANSEKDLMVLEGPAASLDEGLASVLAGVSESLGARTILVIRDSAGIEPKTVTTLAQAFGPSLLGIVVNALPAEKRRPRYISLIQPIEKAGIRLLGVVPEEWALMAVTVADIADGIQGDVTVAAERQQDVVEHLMMGILTSDSIAPYFSRFQRKAVISRGDRPDMQLAALRTDLACLVVTGEIEPEEDVIYRAGERQVPLIRVRRDTHSVAADLDLVFERGRFRQVGKLGTLGRLLEDRLDWATLDETLV